MGRIQALTEASSGRLAGLLGPLLGPRLQEFMFLEKNPMPLG